MTPRLMEYRNLKPEWRTESHISDEILKQVISSHEEKGYSPQTQLSGYIISGDPTYITKHNNARGLIAKYDRYELLESIIDFYIRNSK